MYKSIIPKKVFKKTTIATLIFFLFVTVRAQNSIVLDTPSDTSDLESFDEVLVSSQRFDQKRKYSPRQIEVVGAKRLAELQPATLGDALINSGQVFVQKSQMGGGSPILRGFEASRVLLVMDGVRINNATYRSGHLQDIITIDPFILDRMEVNFGSGSTLYGSDAMGGVLYFKTREATVGNFFVKPSATVRYSSANSSLIGNAGLQLQSQKVGAIFSCTRSQFGDLRSGSKNYSNWDTFGLLPKYVSQINENDTVLVNPDPKIQQGTGYTQTDIFAKVSAQMGKFHHTINFQNSFSGLIPRYDRLSQFNAMGLPVYGRWDYAPQRRGFLGYQLKTGTNKHNIRLSLARQNTALARVTRNFKDINERTQLDKVKMLTLNLDRQDQLANGLILNSGLEFVFNGVISTGINRNILTNTLSETQPRYSDSGATTQMFSIFEQMVYSIQKTGTVIQVGFRLANYRLEALYSRSNPWKLPFSAISFQSIAPSYDLGITQELKKGLMLKASINQAYRNPNIDDMTKVFESQPGSKLVVPNETLKAEQSLTVDLGFLWRKDNRFAFEAGLFHSHVRDLLLDQPGKFNGKDSFLYDGRLTPVYQIVNVAVARIFGFYANAKIRLYKQLWFSGSISDTKGRYAKALGAYEQPLDHIPPVFGQLSLRWNAKDWFLEGQCLFNGTKKAEEYSNSGEDNQNMQPIGLNDINGDKLADGFNPSWQCWTIRGGYQPKSGYNIALSLDNIFDLHYRYFASGMSASGRSINLSLGYRF